MWQGHVCLIVGEEKHEIATGPALKGFCPSQNPRSIHDAIIFFLVCFWVLKAIEKNQFRF